MDIACLTRHLTNPSAYRYTVEAVEVLHTHISVVFLAGSYAYKIKKPVNLGFLNFTTLEKRRHFCEEEVRLNRRLAPTVYLGVVPVTRTATGLCMEGAGDIVEWAVKMERLPEKATLLHRLQRGQLTVAMVEALARKLAAFHGDAEGDERVAAFGRFRTVANNCRENFAQAATQVDVTLSRAVLERLRTLTENQLTRLRPLIEARAARLDSRHAWRFASRACLPLSGAEISR